MVHGPGDRRSYQSPEVVLAEARRMAAEIRRQAERDAAMVRRDAAEWASTIRREAEQRARLVAAHADPTAAPDELDAADDGSQSGGEPPTTVDLTGDDEWLVLDQLPVPRQPVPQVAPAPPSELRDILRTLPVPLAGSSGAEAPASRPAESAPVALPGPDPVSQREPVSEPEPVSRAEGEPEPYDDPYELGRSVALGAWLSAADFDQPTRPTAVASARLPRDGDVIDLRRAVAARRSAAARNAEDAARASSHPTVDHPPVETSIESKVHDVVRLAVRRTFSRRSS